MSTEVSVSGFPKHRPAAGRVCQLCGVGMAKDRIGADANIEISVIHGTPLEDKVYFNPFLSLGDETYSHRNEAIALKNIHAHSRVVEMDDAVHLCGKCTENSVISPRPRLSLKTQNHSHASNDKDSQKLGKYLIQADPCSSGINPSVNGNMKDSEIDMGTRISSDDDLPLIVVDEDFDHCHVKKPVSQSVKTARRQLLISGCICAFFMVMEALGGYLSNSLAIMTDAAHMLSDLASFMVSLFALWLGQKAPTKTMSFGYYRAEVLGAISSILLIWILTGILVFMAVDRVKYLDYDIDTSTMLIVSTCGVAMNIMMGLVLNGMCSCGLGNLVAHCHSHSHSHSHHSHSKSDDGTKNINVRAALIHVIGDLLQSIGVLIAAVIIHFKPEYKIADPICTFIFSALVLATTWSIMRDSLYVLMEGFPRNLNYFDIKTALLNIPGVKMVHSLHVWSLTVDRNALAVHLAIDHNVDSEKVLRTAEYMMRKKYSVYQMTIQVEHYEPSRMLGCDTCQGPAS